MRALSLLFLGVTALSAAPLTCNLADYKAQPGLAATMADNTLTLNWDGDKGQELRLRLTLNGGTPTIRDLSIRHKGGPWNAVATDVSAGIPHRDGETPHEQPADGAAEGPGHQHHARRNR